MDLSYFMELVKDYGYFSMFLFNWVLLFGMPLPNEVAATFSGVLTETSYFRPAYAFTCAYLGLITSNTFAYAIGRVFGDRLIQRLQRTRFKMAVSRFQQALDKRGKLAISLSFFLPGIRWAMPYVVGANRFPLRQYMLYAYSAGFVWMMIYFQLGRSFPFAYEQILENLRIILISVSSLVTAAVIWHLYYRWKQPSD